MAIGSCYFLGERLSTIKEAGESEPSPLPPGQQIRLIQIMQMTLSLARITGHGMREESKSVAEIEWQSERREFGRAREIRSRGERKIHWAGEERKRWRRNES